MDRRIMITKRRLTNSLLDLMKKKSIYEITVLELCKEANINRTTFYKYYTDINDLVKKTEEDLLEELKSNINDIKRNYLLTYTNKTIEIISNNKEIYTRLLGENGDHLFLRRILNNVKEQSIEEWQKLLKKASSEDLNNIYNFIVDGTIGIIENWIKNNCKQDPAHLGIFINKICMSGLSSFI